MGIGPISERDLILSAPEALSAAVRPITPQVPPPRSKEEQSITDREEDAAVFSRRTDSALPAVLLYTAQGTLGPAGARQETSEEMRLAREQYTPSAEEEAERQQNVKQDLERRDRSVRKHEQLHKKYLGEYAGGDIQYNFTVGPDGFDYAMGGSVPVDLTRADTPEETVIKARTIKQAALAPENLSTADRMVAAQAAKMEREAVEELSVRGYDARGLALLKPKEPQISVRTSDPAPPLVILDPGRPIEASEQSSTPRFSTTA